MVNQSVLSKLIIVNNCLNFVKWTSILYVFLLKIRNAIKYVMLLINNSILSKWTFVYHLNLRKFNLPSVILIFSIIIICIMALLFFNLIFYFKVLNFKKIWNDSEIFVVANLLYRVRYFKFYLNVFVMKILPETRRSIIAAEDKLKFFVIMSIVNIKVL